MRHAGENTIVRAIVLVALAATAVGCSTTQEHGTLTIAEKRPDSLKAGDLAHDGVAFVTPLTVTGQEQDRAALALIFTQVLQQMRPTVHILSLIHI